jgi:zinc transporter ZupT
VTRGAHDRSALCTVQVWGYSIAGAVVVSATSFIGAILIVHILAKGGSVAQFSIDALGDVSVINAFPAGILLGLVFLHLLPEGIEFAGGMDWRFSVLTISGFLVGLATEHALILFGLKAKITAHADMAHSWGEARADIESPLPVKVMSTNANVMSATNDVITAYPHGMPVVQSNQEPAVIDPKVQDQIASPVRESPLAFSIFVGDFFCNLFDGIAIGSAFLSCGGLGWLVTASIVIHELPQVI